MASTAENAEFSLGLCKSCVNACIDVDVRYRSGKGVFLRFTVGYQESGAVR